MDDMPCSFQCPVKMHIRGNLRGRSTTHYLIWILDRLMEAIDQPELFGSITLLDFRKTLNYVDDSVVIIEIYGIYENIWLTT